MSSMDTPADADGLALPLSAGLADDLAPALLDAARHGSPDAFREIIAGHQEMIYRFCFKWCGNVEDAQELCQDTFVRAWRNLDQYEPRRRFSHWLYRIALNLCRDHHKSKRSRQRQRTESLDREESPSLPCPRALPDENLAQAHDLEKLGRGIDSLAPKLRAVLILRTQEGLTQEECAEILNCSIRAVEGRLYRARRELQAWWKRHE